MFNLKVREDPKYVASSFSSVAAYYVVSVNGSQLFPFAIYADEQMLRNCMRSSI
jgi:diamine N-acetyltransferase